MSTEKRKLVIGMSHQFNLSLAVLFTVVVEKDNPDRILEFNNHGQHTVEICLCDEDSSVVWSSYVNAYQTVSVPPEQETRGLTISARFMEPTMELVLDEADEMNGVEVKV